MVSSTIALEVGKVAVRQRLAQNQIVGLQREVVATYLDMVSDSLVFELHGYVFKEQAGETVRDKISVKLPVRPWWLPKFLWKRLPLATGTWELSVTPEWTYPSANIKVPNLNSPVTKFYVGHNWDDSWTV